MGRKESVCKSKYLKISNASSTVRIFAPWYVGCHAELNIYCSSRKYGGEQLLININHEESEKCNLVLEGKFNVYEEKEFHKRKSNKLINRCSIRDIGTFKSNVESTTDTVTIITDIDVDRKVDGDNLDKKSVRDGVLINISPETCKETTTIKEYYKVIENGTRLLHYSDNSTFFEIFEIP